MVTLALLSARSHLLFDLTRKIYAYRASVPLTLLVTGATARLSLHSATTHRLVRRRAPAALEPCTQLVVEVRFTLLHARLLSLIQH